MASLSETNPYLRDRDKLARDVARDVYESFVFEGASPRSLAKLRSKANLRSTARSKKAAKSEQSPR